MKTRISLLIIFFCINFIAPSKFSFAQTWTELDSGVYEGSCYSLYGDTVSDLLYVGGNYDSVGAAFILSRGWATWDESHWSDLAGTFGEDRTSCITRFRTNMYAGQEHAGVVFRNYQYDTSRVLQANDSVDVLTVYNDRLYVGGQFTQIKKGADSGLDVHAIASWDGQHWAPVGTGLFSVCECGNDSAHVYGMYVWRNELYVGGRFDTAGGVPCKNFAKWDGTTWSPMGNGLKYATDSPSLVRVIYSYQDKLIIGGSFDRAGDNSVVSNIASLDTNGVWGNMNVSFNGRVDRFQLYNGLLYIGGHFTFTEGSHDSHLAVLQNNAYHQVGDIGGDRVIAMSTWHSALYVGGKFSKAGGIKVQNVVRYTAVIATTTPSGNVSICEGHSVVLNANTGYQYTYQWKLGGTIIPGATNSSYTVTQAGDYTVVVTDSEDDTATSNGITVTVNKKPKATITPSGTVNMCAGQITMLTANTGNNHSYQWKNMGSNISGATNSTLQVTTAGSYKVKVTNTNTGCSKTSKATTVNITCKTGESLTTDMISVFPNPFSYSTTISLSLDATQNVSLKIFDVQGRMIRTLADGAMPAGIHALTWNALDENGNEVSNGIYLLQLSNAENSQTIQLALMKQF